MYSLAWQFFPNKNGPYVFYVVLAITSILPSTLSSRHLNRTQIKIAGGVVIGCDCVGKLKITKFFLDKFVGDSRKSMRTKFPAIW